MLALSSQGMRVDLTDLETIVQRTEGALGAPDMEPARVRA